jgi:hypothetical protein
MMRSLRNKFVFFAMAAVTVLLLVLLLAINGMAYFIFERQSDAVLENLVESDGMFMQSPFRKDRMPVPVPPEMDIMRSARFFIVELDEYGSAMFANVDQIFYVTMDEAVSYAKTAIQRGAPKGRIDRYKYVVREQDDGTEVYFLDMTREQLTMRTLFFVSAVIAFGSWLIVLGFVLYFSGKFVQPIIAGMEKQKQFITNAGHELKTPLAIIQSNNDAMSLIHGENKYNRNIKSQVTRLSELTANLLIQAKLDEEVELHKELINISELTEAALLPYRDTAEAHNFRLETSIAPDISLNTNREAFTQLLTILMDNAIKYTAEDGEILFSLAGESGHISLSEENSCDPDMNIPPERLFERFYRADTARTQTDQRSGYGIGLSVARSICRALGGELDASYPTPGRIRFTARL